MYPDSLFFATLLLIAVLALVIAPVSGADDEAKITADIHGHSTKSNDFNP
ncbi:hypothetical protein [Silvimonas iriomotensis]|nr:hypothetical protein [Silvimonas iriomotensis]